MIRSVTRVDKSLNQDLKNFGCDMTKQSTSKTSRIQCGSGGATIRLAREEGVTVDIYGD
jgi:hypothetical protein